MLVYYPVCIERACKELVPQKSWFIAHKLKYALFLSKVALNTPKIELPQAVGFICQNCGVCCKLQPPDVDQKEQQRISEWGFRDFCEADENGIYWINRKADGSCIFLTQNNQCRIYEVRPAVCKLEPFTIADFNHDCNTVELELNFPFSCCCEGVNTGKEVSREDLTHAAQVIIKKILEVTAEDMELPLTDSRVYAEARSRILRRTVEMANFQL
jgi:Fe-S-cluster containining protein